MFAVVGNMQGEKSGYLCPSMRQCFSNLISISSIDSIHKAALVNQQFIKYAAKQYSRSLHHGDFQL
jgi:hypothetical protein